MTAALIFLNLAVFLIVEVTGGSEDIGHMLDFGAAYTPYILEQGEYYRLFTSMFLHFGMQHLAMNMLSLFVLGGRLERTVGKIRFLMIYLSGGIAGNLLSLYLESRNAGYEASVSAGASGAVFAVTGGLVYAVVRLRGRVEDLSARQVLIMALLSLYLGFAGTGVDNAAHIGGCLGGFILTFLCWHPHESRI
ncbi:MAG: rhomboid family intramembrane serine protease [Blautia sp.]|nr:rhomboid family intramembrane serine protease [Blautia sp.]